MLPDTADFRVYVHAMYDAADPFPTAVCGQLGIVPACSLPRVILLCHRCMAALPDDAVVRSAVGGARWRTWWCTRRIRRAMAKELAS